MSSVQALASPHRIKGKRRRVRWRASGRTVYAYVENNPLSHVDEDGLGKGGKRNLNTEGFTKQSNPSDVERALREAIQQGQKGRIRNLRAILKVIKRGGKMADGLLPMWMVEKLLIDQCRKGDSMACETLRKAFPEDMDNDLKCL